MEDAFNLELKDHREKECPIRCLKLSCAGSKMVESYGALRQTSYSKCTRNHNGRDVVGGLLLPSENLASAGLVDLLQFINAVGVIDHPAQEITTLGLDNRLGLAGQYT
mmetsp:Transcript_14781/g.19343  ORF Transcript_14781/g.19343 Transcript_14781/m.19343 type:complete len:108 (+) Transcript_14781:160-483(+)